MDEFLNVAKTLEIKDICKDSDCDDIDPLTMGQENYEVEEKFSISPNKIGLSDKKPSNYQYQCKKCEKKFLHYSYLKRHDSSVHEEGIAHSCIKCNRAFSRKDSLERHINGVHEKRYPQFPDVKRHNKSGDEGIKYPCSKCNLTFSRKDSLERHINGVHEGLKYPCNFCDYVATQKGQLNTHKKNKH